MIFNILNTLCNDGWTSGSTGRGTCSHHHGIDHIHHQHTSGFEYILVTIIVVGVIVVLLDRWAKDGKED